MKRFISCSITLLTLAVTSLFVSGCANVFTSREDSSLEIQLPGNNARNTYEAEDIDHYLVDILPFNGDSDSTKSGIRGKPGQTISSGPLKEGEYIVMINAFRFKSDDLNQIVAEGRAQATVKSGVNTQVPVKLEPREKTIIFDHPAEIEAYCFDSYDQPPVQRMLSVKLDNPFDDAEGRWIIFYGAKDALISTNNPIDSMLSTYTLLWENDDVLEEMGCYKRIALNNGINTIQQPITVSPDNFSFIAKFVVKHDSELYVSPTVISFNPIDLYPQAIKEISASYNYPEDKNYVPKGTEISLKDFSGSFTRNNGTSEHYPNNLQNANYTIEFPDYYDQETFTGILTVTIKSNGLSTTADILIKEN